MKHYKKLTLILAVLLSLSLILGGCGLPDTAANSTVPESNTPVSSESTGGSAGVYVPSTAPDAGPDTQAPSEPETVPPTSAPTEPASTEAPTVPSGPSADTFDPSEIPAYTGKAYAAVHGNVPYFGEADYRTDSFETYAPLDSLGRCGVAYANIGQDLMPTEDRGSIGQVKPAGWHTVKYDCVDGLYLYNRCHLIGFQLSGENANTRNLITGTRSLNMKGMLPFENLVADYVKETGNHVLYRVTPVYRGNNLLCDGVLMEGWSVEDGGEGICFCVFAYNAQPGVVIDYATGESALEQAPTEPPATEAPTDPGQDYILNTNSKKFHLPGCSSINRMSEKNKGYYTGSREDLIAQGYSPCKNCNP